MGCRARVYAIVFESDTLAGQIFDLVLLMSVLTSTMLVMLESVHHENRQHRAMLKVAELAFCMLFTAEYVVRCIVSRPPSAFIFSFFGLVDLMAILPTIADLLQVMPGSSIMRITANSAARCSMRGCSRGLNNEMILYGL